MFDSPLSRRDFLAASALGILAARRARAMTGRAPESATASAALFARIVDAREVARRYDAHRRSLPAPPALGRPVDRAGRYGIDQLVEDVGLEGFTDLDASRVWARGDRFFFVVRRADGLDARVPFALRYRAAGTGGTAPGAIAVLTAPAMIALARAAQIVANRESPARARELFFPIGTRDVPTMAARDEAVGDARRAPVRTAAGWLRIAHESPEAGQAMASVLVSREPSGEGELARESFDFAYRA